MNRPAPSLAHFLHDAARLLRKRFEVRMTDLGLSSAQWRLLAITFRDGRVTQARLAERLEIEPISVSRLVNRMETAGWVARVTDPADKRIRMVVPTEKAIGAHDGIRRVLDEVIDEALVGFTPAEGALFRDLLQRLVGNLADQTADGRSDVMQDKVS